MTPLVAICDVDVTSAWTSASLVTSDVAMPPPSDASRPIEKMFASVVATLRPRARTVSDAASVATSGMSALKDASTSPRTVALGLTTETLIDPPPTIEPVAVARFAPVASTCTAPVDAIVVVFTIASMSALDVISDAAMTPFAAPKMPMDTTADAAVAVLPPVACTVTPVELETGAASVARVAP